MATKTMKAGRGSKPNRESSAALLARLDAEDAVSRRRWRVFGMAALAFAAASLVASVVTIANLLGDGIPADSVAAVSGWGGVFWKALSVEGVILLLVVGPTIWHLLTKRGASSRDEPFDDGIPAAIRKLEIAMAVALLSGSVVLGVAQGVQPVPTYQDGRQSLLAMRGSCPALGRDIDALIARGTPSAQDMASMRVRVRTTSESLVKGQVCAEAPTPAY
jgi:hypothetical protein